MQPFTIHEFKIFAPITLNGQSTFAYLDTGAAGHAIAPAAAIGMDEVGKETVQGALGREERRVVRIDNLNFLGELFCNVRASIEDALAALEGVPFSVSIRLGAPILLAKPLVVDFKRLKIGFVSPPFRSDLIHIPTEFVKGLPIFEGYLGEKPVRAIFDLGAGFSVLNSARRDELGLELEFVYSEEVTDPSGAEAVIEVWRYPRFGVKDILLGGCELLAIDLTAVEEKLGTQVDFILGVNAMLRWGRVWVIDSHSSSIWLANAGVEVADSHRSAC
ncbi:MAG: retropepsin-like aspartic protease [Ardenticatenia bacterium]|nr:retropepsin-like aspartic protease [Ardenticatenia bacterium]